MPFKPTSPSPAEHRRDLKETASRSAPCFAARRALLVRGSIALRAIEHNAALCKAPVCHSACNAAFGQVVACRQALRQPGASHNTRSCLAPPEEQEPITQRCVWARVLRTPTHVVLCAFRARVPRSASCAWAASMASATSGPRGGQQGGRIIAARGTSPSEPNRRLGDRGEKRHRRGAAPTPRDGQRVAKPSSW